MIQFQENTHTDKKIEGWTDLFYRTLPATAGDPTSTTAVKSQRCSV